MRGICSLGELFNWIWVAICFWEFFKIFPVVEYIEITPVLIITLAYQKNPYATSPTSFIGCTDELIWSLILGSFPFLKPHLIASLFVDRDTLSGWRKTIFKTKEYGWLHSSARTYTRVNMVSALWPDCHLQLGDINQYGKCPGICRNDTRLEP